LHNLDVNSAFYDPKTRSMRENPFKGKDPAEYANLPFKKNY
jgi:pre-mRNA-processing factor SLU7